MLVPKLNSPSSNVTEETYLHFWSLLDISHGSLVDEHNCKDHPVGTIKFYGEWKRIFRPKFSQLHPLIFGYLGFHKLLVFE